MNINQLLRNNILTTAALVALLVVSATAMSTGRVQLTSPISAVHAEQQPGPFQEITSRPMHLFPGTFADKMKKVFTIGREVGHPETLQAILLQESNGGRSAAVGNRASPVGKRSYGLMQVQVVAARSVLQHYPAVANRYFPGRAPGSLFDEEIIALLLTNDEANIRIAAHHFNLYLRLSDGDWERAVAAYNVGIGGVERLENPAEYAYVLEIKAKMDEVVRPFNQKHKLRLPA